ncbi:hypothetical protein TCE0_033f08508 [Talaromyces pinophilus]|uniref:Uncharacterized protein n=1 Tax=Talaromyces pinophilus TaxID=128442 RepID=A0A6V8H9G6_TALPI|nr:hypothetical protein TCE0_033f08508 [Talaromyces pinophilus]
MTSTTSRLRTRLDTLLKTIRDEDIVSDQVSANFLDTCKIRLIQHTFQVTDDESNYGSLYLSQNPPILFAPLPKSAFDDHPFDHVNCNDPSTGKSLLNFIDYGTSVGVPTSTQNPGDYTQYLARYLKDWTFPGFPRQHFPPLIWSLADLSFLVPIRLPGEIYSRPEINGAKHKNQWRAHMYEYWKDDEQTYHPHIIILSEQSTSGRTGSILYGELIQLIAAMRNRAHQRVMIGNNDEDEEPQPRSPPEYYFKYEQRFPVLMVSCVAPQHARIYYACMDGSDVVIRQSTLFNFTRGRSAPFNLFARFLASRRLDEGE